MYVQVKEVPETLYEHATRAGMRSLRLVRGRAGTAVVNLDMASVVQPLGSGAQLTFPNAGGAYSQFQVAEDPGSLLSGEAEPRDV